MLQTVVCVAPQNIESLRRRYVPVSVCVCERDDDNKTMCKDNYSSHGKNEYLLSLISVNIHGLINAPLINK